MPFVWQSQSRSNANSSISKILTLNVFFDDHYMPHIKVAKKETKHDSSACEQERTLTSYRTQ